MFESAVGVSRHAGHPVTVLRQSGLRAVAVDSLRDGMAQGLRVFFWRTAPHEIRGLPSESAIAILTDHESLAGIVGDGAARPDASFWFACPAGMLGPRSFLARRRIWTTGLPCVGQCFNERNEPIAGSGIVHHQVGAANLVSLPWNLVDMQLGDDWGYRPYYSSATGRHFVSVGPWVESGALRRLVLDLLVRVGATVGVRMAPPRPTSGAFAVRLDADGFSEEGLDAALRIAKSLDARFTWFIDVFGWTARLSQVRRLVDAGQDVQLHCFYHTTYLSRRVNRANIRAGIRALRGQGVRVRAFASPYGYYYDGLRDAVRDLAFDYSSEFGFATDDRPAYPLNDPHGVLQVPCHPGAICDFRSAGFSDGEIIAHLESVIERQVRHDGMALLYDHPRDLVGPMETAYAALLRRQVERGRACVNMSDYAARWSRGAFAADAATAAGPAPGDPDAPVDEFRFPPSSIFEQMAHAAATRTRFIRRTLPGWWARYLYRFGLRRRAG